MFDRLGPVFLVLIDVDQMPQRVRHVRVDGDEIGEQGFGAIEQAGAHVVLAEFEHGDGLFFVAQVRTRDQMLMHANRAIDFAAAAEQIAEREMRLDRIAIEFGQLQEYFDGLVGLLVEQIVQAAEVARRQFADADAARTFTVAPSRRTSPKAPRPAATGTTHTSSIGDMFTALCRSPG